jgi:hypothetical protein
VLKSGIFESITTRKSIQIGVALVLFSVLALVSSPEALSQGVNDALTPIMDSTENDPAGAQLMFMCIGLLVTLVLTIFGGTMYYMLRAKKKPAAQNPAPAAKDETE